MEEEHQFDGDISGSHVKIGTKSNGKRNALLGIAALIGVALVVVVTMRSSSNDAPKLAELAAFRAAFAEKCNAAEFAGETPSFVATEYLNSSQLQEEVKRQAAALAGGKACPEIEQALRTAAFPMSGKH